MSALDRAIIEQLPQLSEAAKQRVLSLINEELSQPKPQLTMAEWLERADKLRAEIAATKPMGFVFNSVDVLNEVREERLNDLMDSSGLRHLSGEGAE